MNNKCLAIGCILLFFGTFVTPTIAQDTEKPLPPSRGNWLYVGGSGSYNYTRIQDAIDDANNRDTVFVYAYSSPYNEYIIVDKSIDLIGENMNITVINGSGNITVVKVTADSVNISGFTIQNGGADWNHWYQAGIEIQSKYNTISGNNILDNCQGIFLKSTYGNNKIIDNNIINNYQGIFLFASSNYNCIDCNNIKNNHLGLRISNSDQNTIKGNNIQNNSDCGISLLRGYENIIIGNNISNDVNGLNFFVSFFNTVEYNIISNNICGLDLFQCGKNNFKRNNFFDNLIQVCSQECERSKFDSNYWDDWIGNKYELPIFQKFPKIIYGFFYFYIDWYPAKDPYDIRV